MSELYLSPNNITIGREEIEYICSYLKISEEELNTTIISGDFSFYFHINTQTFRMNVIYPPHICYELYILYKKHNRFYTQVFSKSKYPLEFKTLNNEQRYYPLFPLGYTGFPESIDYPVYKLCHNNDIYSNEEIRYIRKLFHLPNELIDMILSYFIKDTYELDNHTFYLTGKVNLNDDIYVNDYFTVSDKKLVLAIKSN